MSSALSSPAWLQSLRQTARDRLESDGLPGRRDEAWKYTDVGRLEVMAYPLAERPGSPDLTAAPASGERTQLILVNGFLHSAPAQLPAGVSLTRLQDAQEVPALLGRLLPEQGKSFATMNSALFEDGLVLQIEAHTDLEHPIELISLGQADGPPVAFHPRLLLVMGKGARATLVERHAGQGQYFSNSVAELLLAEDSCLSHYVLQDEAMTAVHLALTALRQDRGSRYQAVLVQTGGRLSRHEMLPFLEGEGASFSIEGAYVARDQQHIDNTTFVVHRAPGCQSHQVFKGVLAEASRGVFQGSVLVERTAQKTNAHQLSKALLLSDRAEMDAKPELEIYADDVKCGHGATIGDIDENALFYLRARGIDDKTARQLLINAFVAEVVESIADDSVRAAFLAALAQHLSHLEATA